MAQNLVIEMLGSSPAAGAKTFTNTTFCGILVL